jgi:hypothetical protein
LAEHLHAAKQNRRLNHRPESDTAAAVVPIAPRGIAVSKVSVFYATPGNMLADKQAEVEAKGKKLELDADDELTKQAFAFQ